MTDIFNGGPLDDILDDALPVYEAQFAWGDGDPRDLIASSLEDIGENPNYIREVSEDNGDNYYESVWQVIPEGEPLPNVIRKFWDDAELLSNRVKRDTVSYVAWKYLTSNGEFFLTPEGRVYYFSEDEYRVLQVTSDRNRTLTQEFEAMLFDRTGISADSHGRTVYRQLVSRAREYSPERETERFVSWNDEKEELYIADHDDGYFALDGESIDHRHNGEDVFFLPISGETVEYIPEDERPDISDDILGEFPRWEGDGDVLMRVFGNRVNYDDNAVIPPRLQRLQFYIHLHAFPFLDYFTAKPIAAIVGPRGSGKTAHLRTIGKFLFGESWTETGMPTDEEDFEAIVSNRPLAFIDNYDDGESWANDILASVATGAGRARRQLYTTMDLANFVPECFIAITSRDPPFRRPDVADRTITFRCDRFEKFLDFKGFLMPITEHRDVMWSVYIDNLNDIVAEIKKSTPEREKSEHRMSVWASFARNVAAALDIEEKQVENLLAVMHRERAVFALEDDPLYRVVRAWINNNPDEALNVPYTASELIDALDAFAEDENMEFTYDRSQTLAKRLSNVSDELDELFGFNITNDTPRKYMFTGDGELPRAEVVTEDDQTSLTSSSNDSDDDMDIDMSKVKESVSQSAQGARIKTIKEIVDDLSTSGDGGVERERVVEKAIEEGFDKSVVESEIDSLLKSGQLYNPNDGHLSLP